MYVFFQSLLRSDTPHFEAAVIDRPYLTDFRDELRQFEVTIRILYF